MIIYSFVKTVCERGKRVNASVNSMQIDPLASFVCQSAENFNNSYSETNRARDFARTNLNLLPEFCFIRSNCHYQNVFVYVMIVGIVIY